MAITAITIENFKGIKEPVRVELKPITLLFGPNSAGKSTIIQALHYAREIFERHNLNPDRTLLGGAAIDLGGFESLVHQHDLSLPIRLRLELDLEREDLPQYFVSGEILGQMTWDDYSDYDKITSSVRSGWVELTIVWSQILEGPLISTYSVGINGEELAKIEATDDGRQIDLTSISPFNPVFLERISSQRAINAVKKIRRGEKVSEVNLEVLFEALPVFFNMFSFSEGLSGISKPIPLANQKSVLPQWNTYLSFEDSIWDIEVSSEEKENTITLLSSLISGPGELVRDSLRNFCYIGPYREVPMRGHRPSVSPDYSRWSNGLAAYDKLYYADDEFLKKVNSWLSSEERLSSGYSLEIKKYRELKEDDPLVLALLQDRLLDEEIDFKQGILNLPVKRKLLIHDESRNVELEPQDIGVGISQVLPVVVAALSQRTGIVTIEQPELHIHPALQVALGDLFIEQVYEKTDLFFILETHSEHLLLRLLRRIRESAEENLPAGHPGLTPEYLSVNFIDQCSEDTTRIRKLAVSADGDSLGQWPEGFFEERDGELF